MRLHRTLAPSRRPKWRVASFVASGAAALLSLGWISGCSVLYDLSTEQCSSDSDCVARGGVFESLVCIDNLCQEPLITGCRSNAQCMDEEGNGNEPFACIDRECVRLTTAECPTMLPETNELWRVNLRSDNPVILAGTGLIGGTTFVDDILLNYDLALTELTEKVTTLPSQRRVVMIGCKAIFESSAELDLMMTHLADVVKVPGMVAAMLADDLQRAWTEKGNAANMFFMSPLESDPTLANLQDRGLMWHVGPKFDLVARTYSPLLTRALTHLAVTGTAKVATVVTTDNRLLSSMVTTIEASPQQYGLSFNEKTVAENRTDGNYLGIGISSDGGASIATQVADVVSFSPTVIVSMAGRRFLQEVIPAIENAWPGSGPPRPFYLLSPDNYNDDALRALVASNSSLVSRMAGVNSAAAADSTAYQRYIGRWDIAFPDSRDVRGTENFYDAAYYLIYAAAGAGQNLTSGTNLVTGMNRLLSGAGPFNVGPDDMPAAMATLAVGSASIQLDGTLGPPNFNPVDGTRESVGSVWCFDSSTGFQADVLRYVPHADPALASLSGTFPCIPGF